MKSIVKYIGVFFVAVLCMPHAADAYCYGCGGGGGWGWGLGAGIIGASMITAAASRPRTVVVKQYVDDDSDEVAQLERENKKLRKQLKKQKYVELEDSDSEEIEGEVVD